ncbi:selenide, water dikinase SelD [Bdellovibrio sp. HCB337]|uniref:selenide, water dikinase SelD n=1 Tax=Bdellovibrio sp. HCB337 TaxID=3394358 RepID=UPI0039A4E666
MSSESIALTQTVQKGGCAAKVAASELRKILSQVRFPKAHTELLVDGGLFDDAAIYKVTDDIAMVQTLDFFTPIVDSPRLFGRIAAANSLSDVYAMGGKPKTAMGILAFPIASMPESVIVEVMQGASDVISEAQANFVGGHSIDDDTLKFGLSVTGFVHPEKVWSNAKAQAGDVLILTKALGTGTMTAALKRREATEQDISEATTSMGTLNNVVDFLDTESLNAIHAATDITGFGLSGHSMQLAKASQVSLQMRFEALPKFTRAMEFLEKGFLTKAHRSNAAYTESAVKTDGLSALQNLLLHDPQTSGGLLLSVRKDLAPHLVGQLKGAFPHTAIIGEVRPPDDFLVSFE